jgi:hypothetical protein
MRRTVHLCIALSLTSIAACAIEDEDDAFVPRGFEDGDKCVRTQGYWKTHNKYATKKNLQDPWPLSEDNFGCGNTWLGWLNTPPDEGHPLTILGHQWIAAQLNWASHAPMPQDVRDALYAGGAYLSVCDFEQEDRDDITAISEILDAYNNGLAGPLSCE